MKIRVEYRIDNKKEERVRKYIEREVCAEEREGEGGVIDFLDLKSWLSTKSRNFLPSDTLKKN